MSNATETRQLTDQLRAIHTAYRGSYARAGLVAGVVLDRRYNSRVYGLDHWGTFRAGRRINLNTTTRELWIRPVSHATRLEADPLDVIAVDLAAHTLRIDALIESALAAGYTLNRFSETLETLAEWRKAR